MRHATLAAVLLLPCLSFADDPPNSKRVIGGTKVETPPVIDGDLSDEVWKTCPMAEGFSDRQAMSPVLDQTICRIVYDEKAIYVAFMCFERDPSKIDARETIRDHKYANPNQGNPNREDNVTLIIDPFNTRKGADWNNFSVNAIGTRSAKIAGGRGDKTEWKGDWEAKVKRLPDGWSVEMMIPWEILNYPSLDKPCDMTVNFHRFQNWSKVESVWSSLGLEGFADRAGTLTGVQPPKRRWKPRVSLLPYTLPGWHEDKGFIFRSGMDVRYPLTPEMTSVMSINPDFGTIEGAVEGIAFTQRERFIPERRPFFVEGGEYFYASTRYNDIGALFYTQRVRSFDLGTKVYGKMGAKGSLGFLNTVTFQKRSDTVLHYRHDLNDKDRAGIFYSRLDRTGEINNQVASANASFQRGNWGYDVQLARTYGRQRNGGAVIAGTSYIDGAFFGMMQYHSLSEFFRADNGFIPYFGYTGLFGIMSWNWIKRTGPIRSHSFSLSALDWRKFNGDQFTKDVSLSGSFETRDDYRFAFNVSDGEFEGQDDRTITLAATSGVTNRFRQFGVAVTTGLQGGNPSTFMTPSAAVRLFRRFDVSYSGALLNLQGVTSQHVLTASYEISPTRSFGGRLVTLDGDTNWYVSYRHSGQAGINHYVIFGDPNARKFQGVLQWKTVVPISL